MTAERGSASRSRTAALGALGVVAAGAGVAVARTLAAFRASPEERRRALPGDQLVPDPMYVTTQAVDIAAAPDRIWPWVVQMGAGRAGWYSYDRIDNAGRPSARALVREHQHVAPGDLLPATIGATDAFVVAEVAPELHLVLTAPRAGPAVVSWAFVLDPRRASLTRLIVRARVSPVWREMAAAAPTSGSGHARPLFIERVYGVLGHLPVPFMLAAAGFGHRLMQNKQLRGIKRRAET